MTSINSKASDFLLQPIQGVRRYNGYHPDKFYGPLIEAAHKENTELKEENYRLKNLLQLILHEVGSIKITNASLIEFSNDKTVHTQSDARDNSITISVGKSV